MRIPSICYTLFENHHLKLKTTLITQRFSWEYTLETFHKISALQLPNHKRFFWVFLGFFVKQPNIANSEVQRASEGKLSALQDYHSFFSCSKTPHIKLLQKIFKVQQLFKTFPLLATKTILQEGLMFPPLLRSKTITQHSPWNDIQYKGIV